MTKPLLDAPSAPIATPSADEGAGMPRRALLRKLGRYAAVTPPAVTLLLAVSSKPAAAFPSVTSSRQFKNRAGPAEGAVLITALAVLGEGAPIDATDGVGICLAAIKALNARLDILEGEVRAASL
jgi:hypothetical protein